MSNLKQAINDMRASLPKPTVKEEEDEDFEECCGNCGWTGDREDCLDDIYNEGAGHYYCPNCELSI
jgi:hypothetical protein